MIDVRGEGGLTDGGHEQDGSCILEGCRQDEGMFLHY